MYTRTCRRATRTFDGPHALGQRYHRAMVRAALITAAVLLGACADASTQTRARGTVDLADCRVPGIEAPALCGTYEVWENRSARSGRRVPLRILIVPARNPQRSLTEDAGTPVFYFDGGPGGSATGMAGWVSRLLRPVNDTRDLVFVDVRGTGGSAPLHCPVPGDEEPLQRWFDEFLSDDYVRACLEAQEADVRFYTQPIAMDDIDEVRAALGYGRINLFGTSGGTRQAQLYMRQHAASVRTAVLQGVAPLDAEVPSSFARAMEIGMRSLIAADPPLAESWERARARFTEGPVRARVRHPISGRTEEVTITRGVFADGVRHMLYNFNGARPLAMRIEAAGRGDFGPFAQAELELSIGFSRGIAHGFLISATCAEDVRFIDEADVRRKTEGTFLGDYRIRRQQAACRIWPKGEGIDEGFQEPLRTSLPVLLLSGDADVATPAEDAERMMAHLPNARHVIFENQGHALRDPGCASKLIAAFIASADVRRVDAGCATSVPRD
jgi:pimeloyl-ACP methyl ester carboxylesterase